MKKIQTVLMAALATALVGCAAPAFDAGGPGAVRTTKLGPVLVDANGMTLYVYDKDSPGKSNCSGMCAFAWPPAEAAKDARAHDGFTLVERADGSRQWAYHDHPLYGYVEDSQPGDVSGDGAEGVWHAARK